MLLAVVSIILSPQPSLFSYVWNKATEKVNDLLQKSAAFTFILKNIRNKQPTQFFLSSHLRHLMGSYLLPFLLSISKFIYFVSSPPIKCAELSSLYRRHHKACQATTPPTFCWNILKNAAGILNHSNPKSAPSLCCTKCAQVEHLVLDDSRCIWYLYHQQLSVKYYINREKCQRPDYFFWRGIIRFSLLLLTLVSSCLCWKVNMINIREFQAFTDTEKVIWGQAVFCFPLDLNSYRNRSISVPQDYF